LTVFNPVPVGDLVDLITFQWGPMAFGDTAVPVARGDIVDRSIQVEGTFQTGTNVQMQGSNDAVSTTTGHYHILTDPFAVPINITAASIRQVTEVTAWMKPVITAGTGTEAVTITICSRKSTG
jgi:hypothetical protein